MAVFTPSYPLTFPTNVGVQTQRFSLVRTGVLRPFTGQDQGFNMRVNIGQHKYNSTNVKAKRSCYCFTIKR